MVINVTFCIVLTEFLLEKNEPEPLEPIPEEVLLDTPGFPSALQVFASVGGLALLAEHLPLLYPEVTRQVTPPPVNPDVANSNAIGNDWVTVESTEDIYEVFMAFPHICLRLIILAGTVEMVYLENWLYHGRN